MPKLSNFTFEEIAVGQTAEYSRVVGERDVQLFAAVSGDVNPLHLDAAYAATTPFGQRIAHGMLSGAVVSGALGMVLPGPGSIYLSQSLQFKAPVALGDVVTVRLLVTAKRDRHRVVYVDCTVVNQDEKVVTTGKAEVIAPARKITLDSPAPPRFVLVE